MWTCADSRDTRAGAYQTYAVAKSGTVGKIPDGVSVEDAATIGTGLVTAAVALYWFFKMPRADAVGGGPIQRSNPQESSSQTVTRDQRKWIM